MAQSLPLDVPPVPDATKEPSVFDLSSSQEGMYNEVLAHFSAPEPLTIAGFDTKQLTEEEKFWLSKECLLRYLRASKWVVATAIQRLQATLKWRREMGLYDKVTDQHVEPESLTGKEILFGYDVDRRPALYLLPSRQNTEESPRQIEFTVWYMERTIELMGPGVENLALLINYADKAKNPSLKTSKTVLDIIQSHYPERLGRALVLNVPWLLNAFYKLITPFIDPVTRTKMRFNPDVIGERIFETDMVMKSLDGAEQGWGGEVEFVWKHETYWNGLTEMCAARRWTWRERWKVLGGKVGIREWDYKRTDAEVGHGDAEIGGHDESE